MNTKYIRITAIAIAALMLVGCTASQYLKKGTELEAAGLYEQAANAYLVSLSASRDNPQAMIGLKNTGQRAIDDMASQVVQASAQNDDRAAVYRFHEVDQMATKASRLGVTLQVPSEAKVAYTNSLASYTDKLYTQSQTLLDANKYTQAESVLKELRALNPAYADVDDLLLYSRAEPMYQSALALMNKGKNRQAYTAFGSLLKSFPDYKDAANLRDEALQRAQLTVRVDPFVGPYNAGAYVAALREHTMAAISGLNHQFIKVVDPQAAAMAAQDRLRTSQGNVSINQLLGAKAFIHGDLTEFFVEPEHTTRQMRKGYLRHERKVRDKNTGQETIKIEYEKVTYEECVMRASAVVTVKYQMVLAESGTVLISDVAHAERRAELAYVEFRGDHKKLVPGHWISATRDSDKDYIETDAGKIKALQRMCTEKRGIPTSNALLEEAAIEVASRIASRVGRYNPE